MKRLLFLVAAILLSPLCAWAQGTWPTLNVDLAVPMNTSTPGTTLTAAIANAGTASSFCVVGTSCFWSGTGGGAIPAGYTVGANQDVCSNLGPVQLSSGGTLYPTQSMNYNNYAHSDTSSNIAQLNLSGVASTFNHTVTTCITVGVPQQSNGNDWDLIMTQDSSGQYAVLQLNQACTGGGGGSAYGVRIENHAVQHSPCIQLIPQQTYFVSMNWDHTNAMSCIWVWTATGGFVGNSCLANAGGGSGDQITDVRIVSNENGTDSNTTYFQNTLMQFSAVSPTGTGTFTNGLATVTGTGFVTGNVWNNAVLNVGGTLYTIAAVQSSTQLTLATTFSGSSGSAGYVVELPLFWTQTDPWTGVLAPARGADWTGNVGVTGGIPTTRTQCVTTACNTVTSAGTAVTAAQIQAAWASAPSGTYVLLPSGTLSSAAPLTLSGVSNATLRGAGANNTTIPGQITLGSSGGAGGNLTTVSGNTLPGSNAVTLASVANLTVGAMVVFDQLGNGQSGSTDIGGILVIGTGTGYTGSGTSPGIAGPYSADGETNGIRVTGSCSSSNPVGCYWQQQTVIVTSCNGTTTPGASCAGSSVVVGFNPPLAMPNWSTASSMSAWWPSAPPQFDGIEDLTVDCTSVSSINCVEMQNTANSWVKGATVFNSNQSHIDLQFTTRDTIENSYFFLTQNHTTSSYGVQCTSASGFLIENNIFQGIASPVIWNGTCNTGVVDYNFSTNQFYTSGSAGYNQNFHGAHATGDDTILFEGNIANWISGDNVHGTANLNTFERNLLSGPFPACWDSSSNTTNSQTYYSSASYGTCSNALNAVQLLSFHRFYNFVGNVWGTTGVNTTLYGTTANNAWVVGIGYGNGGPPSDPNTQSTAVFWANADSASGFTSPQYNCSNVMGGTAFQSIPLPQFFATNPCPAVHALPPSFYYTSKPSWFPSSKPWPLIGPDVTSGNVLTCTSGTYNRGWATNSSQCAGGTSAPLDSGLVNSNPAMDCYLLLGGVPNGTGPQLTNFNENTCYAISGTVSLTPSSNNFGSVTVGSSSSNATFTLTNTTASTVTGISFSNVGGNTADFPTVSGGTCTTTLVASSSCTYLAKFSPSIVGAESTTLTVNDSFGTQTSALSGTGLSAGSVTLSPTSLAFDSISKGTLSPWLNITLTNGTGSTVSLTSYTFTGTNSGDFLAYAGYNNSSVWTASTAVAISTFIVDSNGCMETVTTAGTTGATPPTWTSPTCVLGQATTTGTAVYNVIGVYPNGCGPTLAAGATCVVVVAFEPTATAGTNETATLNVNYSGGPATAPVTGTSSSAFVTPNLPTAPTQVNLPLTITHAAAVPYGAILNQSLLTPTTTYTVCASGCNYTDSQLQTALNQAFSDCQTNTSLVQLYNTETMSTQRDLLSAMGRPDAQQVNTCVLRRTILNCFLADGNRINHSYCSVMPQIVAGSASTYSIQLSHNMKDFEMRGMCFSNSSSYVTQSNQTFRGSDELVTTTAAIPANVILDQNVFWAGGVTGNLSHDAILLEVNNAAVINNDVENYQYTQNDNQAINMSCSNGPYLISNNALSATTENTMWGGNGCDILDGGLSGNPYPVPSNITVASNYYFKPLRWRNLTCGAATGTYCGAGFSFIDLTPQPTTSACTGSQCQVNVSFFAASQHPDMHPYDNAVLENCANTLFNGTYAVLPSPLPSPNTNPFTFSVVNTNLNSTNAPNGTTTTGCTIAGFFDPQYVAPADGSFAYDVKDIIEMKLGVNVLYIGNWIGPTWQGGQEEMLIFQEANPVEATLNFAPWNASGNIRVTSNLWDNADINGWGTTMWTALNPVVNGSSVGSSLGTIAPVEFDNNLVYALGPIFGYYEEWGSHGNSTGPLANGQLQDLFVNHNTILQNSVNPALGTWDIYQFASPANLQPGQTPFLRDSVSNSIIDFGQILNETVDYPYGSQKCEINSGLAVPCWTPAGWVANIPLATVSGSGAPYGCTTAFSAASFQPNAGPAGVGSSFCPTANLAAVGLADTTINTASSPISPGVRTVTPASMTNISSTAPQNVLFVGSATNAEFVSVISTTGTTFTANFQYAHNSNITTVFGTTPPASSIAHDNGTDGLDVGANAAAVVTMTSWVPSGFLPTTGSVTLAPSSNNFGTVVLGSSSSNVTFTLSNTTVSTVTGITVSNIGGNTADFPNTGTGTCTTSLAASSSCTIIVKFTPSIASSESTTLTVTDSAGSQTSALTGTGVATLALSFNPTSLNLGTLTVSVPSPVSQIQVTNTGTGTVTISSVAVSGAPFALQSPLTAPDCRTVGTLAVSASCYVGINATLTTAGLSTGFMIMTDNATGSPQMIPLSATGFSVPGAPNPIFGDLP